MGDSLTTVAIPAAAAAATPAAFTTAAIAAAARRTLLARARFVDRQRTALEILLVEHFDGLVGVFLRSHFDEGEAAGTARHAVLHDVHGHHSSSLGEVILHAFEDRAPSLYDSRDRELGFIEVANRRGELERFPVMTLTVAGLASDQVPVTHYAELVDRAFELKRQGKAKGQSALVIDRRRAPELPEEKTG